MWCRDTPRICYEYWHIFCTNCFLVSPPNAIPFFLAILCNCVKLINSLASLIFSLVLQESDIFFPFECDRRRRLSCPTGYTLPAVDRPRDLPRERDFGFDLRSPGVLFLFEPDRDVEPIAILYIAHNILLYITNHIAYNI